jgi:hypothetical protein
MRRWIGKDLEGRGHGINEELSQNLCGGTKGSHENLSSQVFRCDERDLNQAPPELERRR